MDPLIQKYPELTPYQFAGNTPIQAVDLDGLEPFFVMGTNQEQTYDINGYGKTEASGKSTTFTRPMLENMKYVLDNVATSGHKMTLNTHFTWEDLNGTLNNVDDRGQAAKSLADYVIANHIENEPITLIGYSHGGNVSLQAAPIIEKKLGLKINIITINTPTSNEYPVSFRSEIPGAYSITLDPPRWVENPDNPAIRNAVNSHYHLYTKNTDWTVFASGLIEGSDNTYKSKFPNQIKTESNEKCANHGNIYCPDTIKPGFEKSKLSRQSNPNN